MGLCGNKENTAELFCEITRIVNGLLVSFCSLCKSLTLYFANGYSVCAPKTIPTFAEPDQYAPGKVQKLDPETPSIY